MAFPFPILELFAGIGGFSTSLAPCSPNIHMAIDIDLSALEIYKQNHHYPIRNAEIESVELDSYRNCFWWMSPPCLPFTRRGTQRDHLDTRSRPLRRILHAISELRPPAFAIENVPPFATSVTWQQFHALIGKAGYSCLWRIACPSELGIPMRRQRFYALALRSDVSVTPTGASMQKQFMCSLVPNAPARPLASYLTNEAHSILPPDVETKFHKALDIVNPRDQRAIAACFASSYGKSVIRSGSYLLDENGTVRYFNPREVANLLGFPRSFHLPPIPRTAYRLLGNSLSIDVVRTLYCPNVSEPE